MPLVGDVHDPRPVNDATTSGRKFTKVVSCMYSGRIIVLLCISMIPIVSALSTTSLSLAVLFLLIAYFMDMLQHLPGTILSFLLFILTAVFGLAELYVIPSDDSVHTLRADPFRELSFLFVALTHLLLCSIFIALQFSFVQRYVPYGIVRMERLLMVTLPLNVIPLFYVTLVSLFPIRHSAFLLSFFMITCHYAFFINVPHSSYLHSVRLIHRADAILYTLLIFCIPPISYLYANSINLWWGAQNVWYHVRNLVILFVFPLLYLMQKPKSMGARPVSTLLVHGRTNTNLSLFAAHVVGTGMLIGLIIFWLVRRLLQSRYGYLFHGIPAPYNEITMNVVGLQLTVLFVVVRDMLQRRGAEVPIQYRVVSWILLITCSLFVTVAVVTVAGMPFVYYPLGLISTVSFIAFLADPKNMNHFFMFSLTAALMLMWWMLKTFAFLDINLSIIGDRATLPIQALASLLVWAFLLSCLSFCLAFYPGKVLFKVCFALHCLVVHSIEHIMYSQPGGSFYPTYYVYVTTLAGLLLCRRLYQNGILCMWSYALSSSVYISKLIFFYGCMGVTIMDSLVEGDSKDWSTAQLQRIVELSGLWWSSIVVFTILMVLYAEHLQKVVRVQPVLHYLYAVAAAVLVVFARSTLIPFLVWLDQGILESHAVAFLSSFSTQMGCGLVFWAILIVPVIYLLPPSSITMVSTWRRLHVAIAACSVLFLFLFTERNSQWSIGEDVDRALSPGVGRALGILYVLGFIISTQDFIPPIRRIHGILTVVWWVAWGALGSCAFYGTYVSSESFAVLFGAFMLLVLTPCTLDWCHYSISFSEPDEAVVRHIQHFWNPSETGRTTQGNVHHSAPEEEAIPSNAPTSLTDGEDDSDIALDQTPLMLYVLILCSVAAATLFLLSYNRSYVSTGDSSARNVEKDQEELVRRVRDWEDLNAWMSLVTGLSLLSALILKSLLLGYPLFSRVRLPIPRHRQEPVAVVHNASVLTTSVMLLVLAHRVYGGFPTEVALPMQMTACAVLLLLHPDAFLLQSRLLHKRLPALFAVILLLAVRIYVELSWRPVGTERSKSSTIPVGWLLLITSSVPSYALYGYQVMRDFCRSNNQTLYQPSDTTVILYSISAVLSLIAIFFSESIAVLFWWNLVALMIYGLELCNHSAVYREILLEHIRGLRWDYDIV